MGTEEKLRVYLKRVTVELAQARKRLTELEERSHEPIAVVGMACRYPGGGTVEDFWDLLRRGDSAVREVPPARWDIDAYYNPEPGVPGGMYTRYGAFLDDVTGWDAEFFGLSPREALRMDPHQRLLLELAWEGLENAGLSPSRVAGSRTGVMVGFMDTLQYGRLQIERQGDEAASDPYLGQGAVPSIAAGRIAYQLDLTGPTVTVDTACSSSLIAIHLAAESLRRGECELALAGGASLTLHPTVYLQACAGLMMCSDGRCKTFDERADGYVMGEGGGMLVLEPLSRALANGRRIRAVLRGSAVNQDGRSNGLTAPSRRAQTDVITRALAAARVAPDEIDYVEAHGSGTHLGDAIELSALHDVFGGRPAERPLRVGAVKTNIGHTQAAAGVAGVIKTILILENGLIPPSLNLSTPAAAIPEDGTVQPVTGELPLPSREGPRLAGVSSFGLSGTNAHVILEAAPTPHPLPPTGDLLTTTPELAASIETASIETASIETAPIETAPIETVTVAAEAPKKEAVPGGSADHTAAVRGQVVPVSAASDAALREQATRLADWLDERPGTSLDDLAHTLQTGRAELDHRRALVCADLGEAVRRLRDIAGNGGGHRVKGRPRIAFLLPGVGDQYAGLGSELYAREPVYAEAVDQCVDLVRRHSGLDLRPFFTAAGPAAGSAAGLAAGSVQGRPDRLAALLGRGGDAPAPADDPLDHAATAHPFLFTVEYALARLLRHRGITPDLLIGYSLGEYVAACLAGVFTLEDALHVVIERAHLITAVPAGRMVAVAAPDDRVRAALSASGVEVDVAARNGPAMTVLSGPPAEIEAATAVLMGEGLACRPLRSAHAFHSALLEPAREKLVAVLETVRRQAPAVTIVSNLTGEPLTAEQATSTSYWADQLVSTVRFADGVRHCLGQDVTAFVELGPGQTLGGLVRQNLAGGSAAVLGTLPPYWTAGQPRDAHAELLASCAALWELGVGVSWERTRPAGGRVLSLPTYPFQRTRFWPENGELTGAAHGELTGAAHGGQAGVAHGGQTDVADAGRPEAGDAGEPGDFTFVPGWRRDPVSGALPTALALPGPLVVLADPEGVGSALADLADASGTPVVEVVAAPGSEARREGRRLTIDPAVPEHYAEAFAQLPPGTVHVAHLWSLASSPGMPDDGELQEALSNGFHSLMLAVQALGERPGRLLTVSRGATEIIGGDVPAPHQALAHGLGRAARHEYAELAWSGVDLDAEAGHPATTTAAQLAHELLSRPEEDTTPEAPDPVAGWRRGRRWVRGWTEVPAPPEAAGVWRPDGAYLITGGTRGLGMALAKHLTRAGVRRLALVARTPLPRTATEHAPTATGHAPTGAERALSATGHAPTGAPHDEGQEQDGAGLLSRDAAGPGEDRPLPGDGAGPERDRIPPRDGAGADEARVAGMLRDVAELEAAGAEVLLLTADTGVPDQLRAALRRAREHFGGLHGVIHAAGLPAGGMLRRRTPDEAARVLAPKVLAMGPLAELVGAGTPPEERPEVLVLYSSAVTAYGGVGEADYCAANTVLDAYGQALAATAPTTRVVSVAWGPWRHDVWQAENLKSSGGGLAGRVADYRARYGFADDAGCALLDRIVAGGHGGVLAVRQPLREVLRAWTSMLDLDDLVGAAVPQGQRFPRPLLRTDYVAPRTEAEAGIAELWGAYLGIDRVGVHDPFFDLGGNSLLGMAMVLALEKQLGRPVPPALLFEHPTVAEFAAAIDGGADPREALTTSSARGQRRRRARSSNRK